MSSESVKKISFFYIFKFIDGSSRHFEIDLDSKKMECIPPAGSPPAWTSFSFHRCEMCTFPTEKSAYCPVAVNISNVVEEFEGISPNESSQVIIMTKNRDYSKSTTLRDGLSALLGLCMTASACPALGKMKPLVRYHLPFATLEENVVRVASMYLLVQYFLSRRGVEPDWKLKGIQKIYDDIQLVNKGISERLKLAASKDAALKAIANLDHTASLVPFVINETLDEIEESLSSYLED
jgi:hypothetical protein